MEQPSVGPSNRTFKVTPTSWDPEPKACKGVGGCEARPAGSQCRCTTARMWNHGFSLSELQTCPMAKCRFPGPPSPGGNFSEGTQSLHV